MGDAGTSTGIGEATGRIRGRVGRARDAMEERTRRWLEPTGPRPVRRLFGRLPLATVVPQDVHTIVADYGGAALCASTALYADSAAARAAGAALGATVLTASLLTDYRLSVAKLLPIEAHQVADYVGGLSQLAAPFLLGYARTDRRAALTHVLGGVAVIALSLLTDYRAAKGIGGHVEEIP